MSDHASRMRAIELEDGLRFIARLAEEDRQLGLSPRAETTAPRYGRRRERLTPYGVAAFSTDPEHIERLASGNVQTSVMIHRPHSPSEIRNTRRHDGRIMRQNRTARVTVAATVAETARHTPELRHDYTS
jgi:hypothetical protein